MNKKYNFIVVNTAFGDSREVLKDHCKMYLFIDQNTYENSLKNHKITIL